MILAKEILTTMSKYYLSMYMYIVQTEFFFGYVNNEITVLFLSGALDHYTV